MGKFGFGKKDKSGGSDGAGDDDSNRSSLFGSRSSKQSGGSVRQSNNPYAAAAAPAASSSSSGNPYAQHQQQSDPYMKDTKSDQYMKDVKSAAGPGRADSFTPGPPPYSENPGPGPGMRGGGGGDVYGGSRYGPPAGPPQDGSRYGPPPPGGAGPPGGGYGGLGPTRSNETTNMEANRDALFGDASNRYQQRGPPISNAPVSGGDGYGTTTSGYGAAPPPGQYGGPADNSNYSPYGENRQLTAEEEEEEDVSATKQQIRLMKQEDVSSTRNALRIAAQAEETSRATLERLAAQGERIHNTEKNLDLANNHNRVAEERAKELKTLNKSMFAVHVSNPFTKTDRRQKRDDDVLNKHRTERDQRDATRSAAFASKSRHDNTFKELRPGEPGFAEQKKSRLAERAKYQFEADSEDDAMEDEIDKNLDALGQAAGRLNAVARATGREVDEQNKQIDTIISKSDRVDDQIAMNRARLDRIH
ncbi:MAG: putative endonuclease lcl3 [Watsoniomyces obsoletus]|nr:MAG: putative endonuclease lcl3 [Watsoniomyces obsoletus]